MILIVEDSSIQRKKMRRLLGDAGYESAEAGDGRSALAFLDEQSDEPELILTDLLMPEMDGVQLLEALQARGSTIPVIVLSADIQESTKKRCYELGVRQFLQKPIQKEVVLPAIKETLEEK